MGWLSLVGKHAPAVIRGLTRAGRGAGGAAGRGRRALPPPGGKIGPRVKVDPRGKVDPRRRNVINAEYEIVDDMARALPSPRGGRIGKLIKGLGLAGGTAGLGALYNWILGDDEEESILSDADRENKMREAPSVSKDFIGPQLPDKEDEPAVSSDAVKKGMPSWLKPLLMGLGAYTGYQRGGGGLGGLLPALLGGGAGYLGSKYIEDNPNVSGWLSKNPALAGMGGLLAMNALGAGGKGGSDAPAYQPYSPMSYKSLGMPGMAQGGIAGGGARGLDSLRTGLRDAIVNSIDDPNRQGVNSFVPSMLKAYDEIPKLQAGGIAGGASPNKPGLAVAPPGGGGGQFGQGTQPSGQPGGGVAPPPLTGANPGFIDPGKQAVRDLGYGTEKGADYGLGQTYGTDPYRNTNQGLFSALGRIPGLGTVAKYGTGAGHLLRQGRNLGKSILPYAQEQFGISTSQNAPSNPNAQAFNAKWGGSQYATGGPGPGPGHGSGVSSATANGAGTGAGAGMPGQNTFGNLGSGLSQQIGQNIMEQRAAMGGLGSNMTEQQLAQGMMGGLAGLQGQEFGQRMGMAGFDQRERENMARFGLAGQEIDAKNNPYNMIPNIIGSIYQ